MFTNISYQFSALSIATLISALFALIIAGVLWRKQPAKARYLALMELAVAVWAFAAGFEMAATTPELKFLWAKISYLGIITSPVAYFLFALAYSQQKITINRRIISLLMVIPLATLFLATTNDIHHLIWTDISINPQTNVGIYGHGTWFWLFIAYVYLLITTSIVLIYRTTFRFPSFYKPQIVALVIGSILPAAGDAIYLLKIPAIAGLDFTPILFIFSGAIIGWGLFGKRMFDLIPIARNILIDTMGNGILVVDLRGQIVDANPAMQSMIDSSARPIIGKSASEVFPLWKMLLEQLQADADAAIAQECLATETGEKRYYDLQFTTLNNRRGESTGKLVVVHDATERTRLQKEHEELITDLQTALAKVKTLSGLLPICANCKKIRDDGGYWHSVESYVREHSNAQFSHGICPDCKKELYPQFTPKTETD